METLIVSKNELDSKFTIKKGTIITSKNKLDSKFNIKNNLINVESLNESYIVKYDNRLYMRFKKISKISKIITNDYKYYIDLIDYCISNGMSLDNYIEKQLVDELSNSINEEILKKLRGLNGNNI